MTTMILCDELAMAGEPAVRIETGAARAEITALSWDTEGTGREQTSLLRPETAAGLRFCVDGQWLNGADLPTRVESNAAGGVTYRITVAPAAEINWHIETAKGRMTLQFSGEGTGLKAVEGMALVLPFAPGVTPVTALSEDWSPDGSFRLPAIVSAPDFGQMLLSGRSTVAGRQPVQKAVLDGSRGQKSVNLALELAPPQAGTVDTLEFTPHFLPPPAGLSDTALWAQARRGWFNIWQPSAQWGDQGHPFSAPAGMLANNVISDPGSCSLWFYADQALWTPEVAPGVSLMPLVRRTIEFWLDDKRLRPTGEVVCYWDYVNFLDANVGVLIAAWDYIEVTGDTEWLDKHLGRLERIADFLAKRDVDNDGLVEATQSGNRGTLKQPARSCAWWDALNCGHKDAYCNALIYRAWRCLADLETKLGRSEQQARYTHLADKLKAAYAPTLLNPATGWLAWWKSADGELHDYASPTLNGLAIEYGLIPPSQGRAILAKLRAKMDAVGFTRFDLGVPPMLVPVLRADYLLPDAIGCPKQEDGTDTVGHYMNGGITAGHVLHFLAAHYVVGEPDPADKILRAMLERQGRGEFQNGVRDAAGQGIDWTTWDGQPSGYEGYLADSFRFLQAVLLREAKFRSRLCRPLMGTQSEATTTVPAAIAGDPLLAEAYRAAAERNVLRALNPEIFFGYFSVCADGQGHGHNTTYPGLDWGQSAEALLWLGRRAEVLASWEYVKGFQREDGLVPFAILPDSAGKTSLVSDRYPLLVDARGAVFEHWVPGNPLRTLANVTFLLLADAIWSRTGDRAWLQAQAPCLRRAVEWLLTQITPDGLMRGGGFYVERPTRLEFDGINQCYSAHALTQAATLLEHAGETAAPTRCRAAAGTLTTAFRQRFWAGDHCVEYIHPEHGPVSGHGLTDVDWAAIATGTASDEQIAVLWPQLKDNPDFIYSGMPGGIATQPETYEDWEMQHIDRHDLAAMGRVWHLECWARARMGDRAGILRSLRQVAAVGKANNWSWMERYYSEKTGDLGQYHFQHYCEYPANFIRIVQRFQKDWKRRKEMREAPPPRGRIPKNLSATERMERKLKTKRGSKEYKKRSQTIEPVFGQIKSGRGIDSFYGRELVPAKGEWNLICATHNLLKLFGSLRATRN